MARVLAARAGSLSARGRVAPCVPSPVRAGVSAVLLRRAAVMRPRLRLPSPTLAISCVSLSPSPGR